MGKHLLFGIFGIGSSISDYLIEMSLIIDGFIYWAVSIVYELFCLISKVQLFGKEEINAITSRIYIVLGIAMLFVFAYNIIVLIANPDDLSSKSDKSLPSLVKNMIISLVLLPLLPTIFTYLATIQNNILDSNVIGKLVLGTATFTGSSGSIESMGTEVAINIFTAFYHPIDGNNNSLTYNECLADTSLSKSCGTYVGAMGQALTSSNIRNLSNDSQLMSTTQKGNGGMEYYYILSTAAGVIALYLFCSFTLDVGVRVAKLGVLELIAPIPVVSRITKPKGGTFDKWLTEISKTYLSIFERLAIIYFAVYAITLVPKMLEKIWYNGGSGILRYMACAILILGILKFAKDAPKLLENIFNMEHVDIGIKKKIGDTPIVGKPLVKGYDKANAFAKNTASKARGYVSGAAGGAVQGFRANGLNGMRMGAKMGAAKGFKAGGGQFNKQRDAFVKDYYNDSDAKATLFNHNGMKGAGYNLENKLKHGYQNEIDQNVKRKKDQLDAEKDIITNKYSDINNNLKSKKEQELSSYRSKFDQSRKTNEETVNNKKTQGINNITEQSNINKNAELNKESGKINAEKQERLDNTRKYYDDLKTKSSSDLALAKAAEEKAHSQFTQRRKQELWDEYAKANGISTDNLKTYAEAHDKFNSDDKITAQINGEFSGTLEAQNLVKAQAAMTEVETKQKDAENKVNSYYDQSLATKSAEINAKYAADLAAAKAKLEAEAAAELKQRNAEVDAEQTKAEAEVNDKYEALYTANEKSEKAEEDEMTEAYNEDLYVRLGKAKAAAKDKAAQQKAFRDIMNLNENTTSEDKIKALEKLGVKLDDSSSKPSSSSTSDKDKK